MNVHTRGRTSLGLIILRGHDSQRLFQKRENLLPGSGVSHSLFSRQAELFQTSFFKLSCSRLKTEKIVLLRAEDVWELTWPNSHRDLWEDLCEIIPNVLASAKTLQQEFLNFYFGPRYLANTGTQEPHVCASRHHFSDLGDCWATVGVALCTKREAVITSGVAPAADSSSPAINVPQKTKHRWTLQKYTMGLPTWRCLGVLEVPRRCEQQGYRPISTKTTQQVDGDKVTVLATSVVTTLEPVKIFSPAPSAGAKHALVSNVSRYVTAEKGSQQCPGRKEGEDNSIQHSSTTPKMFLLSHLPPFISVRMTSNASRSEAGADKPCLTSE